MRQCFPSSQINIINMYLGSSGPKAWEKMWERIEIKKSWNLERFTETTKFHGQTEDDMVCSRKKKYCSHRNFIFLAFASLFLPKEDFFIELVIKGISLGHWPACWPVAWHSAQCEAAINGLNLHFILWIKSIDWPLGHWSQRNSMTDMTRKWMRCTRLYENQPNIPRH